LPSNEEALLRIRSVGSYDSLASIDYQRLVLTFSGNPAATYGRSFNAIALPIDPRQKSFGDAGIGVFLSRAELDERVFARKEQVAGVNVYRARVAPVLRAQLTGSDDRRAETRSRSTNRSRNWRASISKRSKPRTTSGVSG
jgi:hypothetical protein